MKSSYNYDHQNIAKFSDESFTPCKNNRFMKDLFNFIQHRFIAFLLENITW